MSQIISYRYKRRNIKLPGSSKRTLTMGSFRMLHGCPWQAIGTRRLEPEKMGWGDGAEFSTMPRGNRSKPEQTRANQSLTSRVDGPNARKTTKVVPPKSAESPKKLGGFELNLPLWHIVAVRCGAPTCLSDLPTCPHGRREAWRGTRRGSCTTWPGSRRRARSWGGHSLNA